MYQRPIYENAASLSNEAEAKEIIEKQWQCNLHKLPRSLHMDWMATRNGKGVGFVEFKRRSNLVNKYPTIFISVLKLVAAQKLYSATALTSYWVIGWTDCYGHISLNSHPDRVEMGGRADRNDPADHEPMAHYEINKVTLWT